VAPAPRLRVLGAFQLLVADRPADLPWQAQRVLGLLAVRGSAQARSTVAGTLWADLPQARAQANLRNALWKIRAAGGVVVHATRPAVALDADLVVDLVDARRCAHARLCDGAGAPGRDTIDALDRDLLPGWDEEWLVIDRERQRQLRLHALEALSADFCRRQRFPEAIAAALAAVRAEPLRETAQQALITAYVGEGNVSEAVRQLAAYRTLLRDELRIAPGPQVEAIVVSALRARGESSRPHWGPRTAHLR
jgi:DNA-binding SARP family transcriptional activator